MKNVFFHLLLQRSRALRNALRARLGYRRGRWQRGQIEIARAGFAAWFPKQNWQYALYVPVQLETHTSAPLVILLHGCKQKAMSFAQASGWTKAADTHRFRLLCPQQPWRTNAWRCWNWFQPAAQMGQGDAAVAIAMLKTVATQYAVNEQQVVAVGFSAGGALAALLAFHHPALIKAVVTVGAPPLLGAFNLQDPRDVMARGLTGAPASMVGNGAAPNAPLAVIQGDADQTVNPICGKQLIEQGLARQKTHAVLEPRIEQSATGTHTDYRSVDQRLLLRHWQLKNLTHVWSGGPGGHAYCTRGGVALTQLAVDFFYDSNVFKR